MQPIWLAPSGVRESKTQAMPTLKAISLQHFGLRHSSTVQQLLRRCQIPLAAFWMRVRLRVLMRKRQNLVPAFAVATCLGHGVSPFQLCSQGKK
jgi:hypothetical protein